MSWFTDTRKRLGEGIAGRKFSNPGGAIGTAIRAARPLGPWSGLIGAFEPNQVNPYLYEALRRALPPLDGSIDRYVTLDGIVGVEGDNERLVTLIEDFIANVPVNDAQSSLQAFYTGQGNELYEQGYTVGEFVVGRDGRTIEGMRVADSKGVRFCRDESGLQVWYQPPGTAATGRGDGTDDAERIIRGTATGSAITTSSLTGWGYRKLDPRSLIYGVFQPEADNPYGTSLLRSIEFVSQILLSIQNATDRVWQRFGEPPFNITYTTKNKKVTAAQLEERKRILAANLATAMEGKRKGNSVDFVNAIGPDDTIEIEVLGATEQVLQIEMPARHLLEQILSKLGLPSWMLGFSWNTSDRSGDAQVEMILQGAKTRWEQRAPALRRLIETYLRLQGRTWKPGDWKLVQRLPNLRDELKAAQAGFLRAQTVLMLDGGGEYPDSPAEPGSDPRSGRPSKMLNGPLTAKQLYAAIEASNDPAELAANLARLRANS